MSGKLKGTLEFDMLFFLFESLREQGLTTGCGLGCGGEINSSDDLFTLSLAFWLGVSNSSLGEPVITSSDCSSSWTVTHFLFLVLATSIDCISHPTILPPCVVISRHRKLSLFE